MFNSNWNLYGKNRPYLDNSAEPYWHNWPSVVLGRSLGLVSHWVSPDGARLVMRLPKGTPPTGGISKLVVVLKH